MLLTGQHFTCQVAAWRCEEARPYILSERWRTDIENTVVSLSVFSVDTSDLNLIFVSNRLMEIWVLHELWKVDVNGGSETSSKIGWAGRDVSEMLVVGELGFLLDEVSSLGESGEDGTDVGSRLHGNDSELIFFVDPDKEGLVIIVEDSSSLWPVSLKTAGLKIFVTTLEEEMISDELLFLGISHLWEGVVLTLEITSESVEGGNDEFLNGNSVLSGDLSTEWVSGEVSGNSDSSGVDHLVLILWEWWAVELLHIHGGNVLVSLGVSVVVQDNLIEQWGEGIVRIVGSSVDTDTRVGPLGSGEDGLLEGEAELILLVLALLPDIWGKAFAEDGLGSSWEVWKTGDGLWSREVRSHEGSLGIGWSSLSWVGSDGGSVLSTHCDLCFDLKL